MKLSLTAKAQLIESFDGAGRDHYFSVVVSQEEAAEIVSALAQQAQPEMPCEHHNIRQNHNATGLYCADCNTEQ